jgi:hypothetical protein
MKKIKIMGTEEYAHTVYSKYSRTGKSSQVRVRQMIYAGKDLPQVVKIDRFGVNDRYFLLHVDMAE